MKLFATRVWGFDPYNWPVVTFGLDGHRDNLIMKSSAGDAIVFVGTQGEPTPEKDQGRLLGVAQFGRDPVDTLEIIPKEVLRPEQYDERGNFRWPKALIMTRVWEFIDDPKPWLLDVLEDQLTYQATIQAVELNERDTRAVFELPAKEIALPENKVLANYQRFNIALTGGKPTKGVVPSAWSGKTGRTLGNESVTYALRFGTNNCWKVGHTIDFKRRLGEINKHIPTEVLNAEWKPFMQQKWPDEGLAYDMEQRVLNTLDKHRSIGERITCTKAELESAWIKALHSRK